MFGCMKLKIAGRNIKNLRYADDTTLMAEIEEELQTGYKLGKEYIKAVYCHLAYLTYMQNASCEMPGWMKHKLGSILLGEISITSSTKRCD